MKRRARWLPLLCLLVGASAAAQDRCAGGGAETPVEGGIGGTGRGPGQPGDDDGIGGTGIDTAETAIVGTITGFASICVGGIEVHVPRDTPIAVDGTPAAIDALAVGQTVAVRTVGTGAERRATDVAVGHVVVGPITAIDPATRTVSVMDQTIVVGAETRGDAGATDDGNLAPGTTIRVSGMRRADGTILASRIVRAAPDEPAQIVGTVAGGGRDRFTVGGTPVESATAPAAGTTVRVVGRWTDGALRATAIAPHDTLPAGARVSQVVIEGFPQTTAEGRVRIGDVVVSPGRHGAVLDQAGAGGARVRVFATIERHRIVAERVDRIGELPTRPEARYAPRLLPSDDRSRGEPPRHSPAARRPLDHGAAGGERDPLDGRPARGDRDPSGSHSMRPDLPNRADDAGRPDTPARPEGWGRPDTPDRPDRAGRPDRPERPEWLPRPERPTRPGDVRPPDGRPPSRPDRPDRPPTSERPDRPPAIDRPARP